MKAMKETEDFDVPKWRNDASIYENVGNCEGALICWLNILKHYCGNSNSSDNNEEVNNEEVIGTGNRILENANSLVQPAENIDGQDLLTQLYALGCSFHQQKNHPLAINIFESAVELFNYNLQQQEDNNLNANKSLLMKIYFELACCRELASQVEQAIADFRTTLHLAIHNNDVFFEKMILLRLCKTFIETELFEEAAAGYIKLLAIKSDIKKTLDGDKIKFRAHWTVECDCEIRYNLCIAFKELHLYEQALKEGLKFSKIVKTLKTVNLAKSQLKSYEATPHAKQINFILGEIYESMDDASSAFVYFLEFLNEVKDVYSSSQQQDSVVMSVLTSAYERVGQILLKLLKYDAALDNFAMLVAIGRTKNKPDIEVQGLLYQGNVLLAQNKVEKAREVFGQALKLAQVSVDDGYALECKCMSKEAEVYAHECRYTHALYRCEQAICLARKSGNIAAVEIERQAAFLSQHSKSEKEQLVAVKFLYEEIVELESRLQRLKSEGVMLVKKEEDILKQDYTAIQVLLHRLGEHKLSLAFGECFKRREFVRIKTEVPTLPKLNLKGISSVSTSDYLQLVDADYLLLPDCDCTFISFVITDAGLLAHVCNTHRKLTYSYLSSDHVISTQQVQKQLIQLVDMIYETKQSDPVEKLHLIYNTENRCLPDSTDSHTLKISSISKTNLDGSGDSFITQKNYQSLSSPTPYEGENVSKQTKDIDDASEMIPINPLEELYRLLVQPLHDALNTLPENSSLIIVCQDKLAKIPFDHLINCYTGQPFASMFDVITIPCLHVLNVAVGNKTSSKQHSSAVNRQDYLLRTYKNPESLHVMDAVGMEKSINGLVSTTASGTNILSSSQYLTPYTQEKFPDRACVIGCPEMSTELRFKEKSWKPSRRLPVAQKECKNVTALPAQIETRFEGDSIASTVQFYHKPETKENAIKVIFPRNPQLAKAVAGYLDVSPITGKKATKTEFLQQLSQSTVIHVSTYGSVSKGLLAFRPDSFPFETEPISEDRYLVTLPDLLDIENVQTRLIVLSSGQKCGSVIEMTPELNLPQMFLSVGVQSVVFSLWSVPDVVSETFFFHFYLNLQRGSYVSKALHAAKLATRKKYSNPKFWNAFAAIGTDVIINLGAIRGAELHRNASEVEADKLMAALLIQSDTSPGLMLLQVQQCLSRIASHLNVSRDGDIIPFLLGLIEEATDRLTKDENSDRPVIILPQAVEAIEGSKELLELIGFDFQNVEFQSLPESTRNSFTEQEQGDAKMIIFPHWNQDNLMLPVHQALSGLLELCMNQHCVGALSLLLPLQEDKLCKLIDLLAVFHHSSHLQLHISDHNTKVLWSTRRIREYLNRIGITSVRSLLLFQKTVENKSLLIGSLQLLLAVCSHRGRSILEELNVETLGKDPVESEEKSTILKSFKAVLMPRNEIKVTSSWLSGDGHVEECNERKSLADQITHVTECYSRALNHVRWWHQDVKIPKQPSLSTQVPDANRPSSPRKVKVATGATPSCNRTVLTPEPDSHLPKLSEVLRRREEARNVLHKRCVDIQQRQASALRSSYLPYVKKF